MISYKCSCCQDVLAYSDSRIRIRKKEGGHREFLKIRRFRYKCCHFYHNELPVLPHPRINYEIEVLSRVLLEPIRLERQVSIVNYPPLSFA
ncbi:MAG: DUF6431 domain-containing protein [Lachnospiraceae bacterium]